MAARDPAPARVAALWRFPVKSLQGEALGELRVNETGVVGDRAYGVRRLDSGFVLSAKREGRLLEAFATLREGVLEVRLPDGRSFHQGTLLDDALSAWLEASVALVGAATYGAATFEGTEDFEHDDPTSVNWEGRSGSFVDESALHLVTDVDLNRLAMERPDLAWDVRRFRPNVVVATNGETLDLAGVRRVRLGEVELLIEKGCTRCVMTTRTQPGGLTRELDVLRHVSRAHRGVVGVRAGVSRGGLVRVGDEFSVLD